MSKKKIEELTIVIDKVVNSYEKLDKACNQCIEAGCMDVEGKLFAAIWESFDAMLDCIDNEDMWIHWYVYDNECGKKQYEAKGKNQKKSKQIKCSKDLAKLIIKDLK